MDAINVYVVILSVGLGKAAVDGLIDLYYIYNTTYLEDLPGVTIHVFGLISVETFEWCSEPFVIALFWLVNKDSLN